MGKFVEFFGAGAASLPVVDRATIGNMAPEYGATMGFFPLDDECTAYLRATGRPEDLVRLYESYYRAQGLWGMPRAGAVDYSQVIEIDLGGVTPSVAGPRRPQDRIELPRLRDEFTAAFSRPVADNGFGKPKEELALAVRVSRTADGPSLPGGGSGEPVSATRAAAAGTNPATEREMANNRPTPNTAGIRSRRWRASSATAAS